MFKKGSSWPRRATQYSTTSIGEPPLQTLARHTRPFGAFPGSASHRRALASAKRRGAVMGTVALRTQSRLQQQPYPGLRQPALEFLGRPAPLFDQQDVGLRRIHAPDDVR